MSGSSASAPPPAQPAASLARPSRKQSGEFAGCSDQLVTPNSDSCCTENSAVCSSNGLRTPEHWIALTLRLGTRNARDAMRGASNSPGVSSSNNEIVIFTHTCLGPQRVHLQQLSCRPDEIHPSFTGRCSPLHSRWRFSTGSTRGSLTPSSGSRSSSSPQVCGCHLSLHVSYGFAGATRFACESDKTYSVTLRPNETPPGDVIL